MVKCDAKHLIYETLEIDYLFTLHLYSENVCHDEISHNFLKSVHSIGFRLQIHFVEWCGFVFRDSYTNKCHCKQILNIGVPRSRKHSWSKCIKVWEKFMVTTVVNQDIIFVFQIARVFKWHPSWPGWHLYHGKYKVHSGLLPRLSFCKIHVRSRMVHMTKKLLHQLVREEILHSLHCM